MFWIDELKLKRSSEATNVYICQTFDLKRKEQLRQAVKNGFPRPQSIQTAVAEYDVQRSQVISDTPEEVTMDPLSHLDRLFTSSSKYQWVVIASYVYSEEHARTLSDYLVSWSQRSDLYRTMSTVVVFTADENIFSEALRRFAHVIRIPPSTSDERDSKLNNMMDQLIQVGRTKRMEIPKQAITQDLVDASSGLTLHEVETAASESFNLHNCFTLQSFTDYKKALLGKYNVEYIEPKRGWESVQGQAALKQYLEDRVKDPLVNSIAYVEHGITPPRGLMMYGPPGTGKTWIAKAFAKEVGLPMLSISPSDFLGSLVGQTEARVRQVVSLIESMAPVIVFVDEAEQLFPSRAQLNMATDSGVSTRMVGSFLTWLGDENRRTFIIGATNYIDKIDAAVLRQGRFDKTVLVMPPSTEERKAILAYHLQPHKLAPDVLEVIAKNTELWSSAELAALSTETKFLAKQKNCSLKKNLPDDLSLEAVEKFAVNTQTRLDVMKQYFTSYKNLENHDPAYLKAAQEAFKTDTQDSKIKNMLDQMGK